MSFDPLTHPRPTRAEDIDGWMSPDELSWLRSQSSTMNSIVEIGAYKGRSTHAFLTSMPPSSVLTTVDAWSPGITPERVFNSTNWDDVFDEFIENVTNIVGVSTTHHIVQSESAALGRNIHALDPMKRYDMVWIDGGHMFDQVTADLVSWFPMTTKLICGHDYDWPSVKSAVNIFFGPAPLRLEVYPGPGSIWYVPLST